MNQVKGMEDVHLAVYKDFVEEDLLRKIGIFKDLPGSSLKVIRRHVQVFSLKKGDVIFSEKEAARGVYFIHTGAVKMTKVDEKGNELIVCVKQKGDTFAEACLFSKKLTTNPATATMLMDGELLFLDKEELERELYRYPDLAIQLIGYMSETLREMTSTLRDVVLLDVYSKTVRTLEKLGEKFNHNQSRRDIEIPMTIVEFASVVGARRESVSRVFSKLKKDKVIDLKPRKIIILDWCRICLLKQEEY